MYPNPTSGLFKLEIESTYNDLVHLDLYDLKGRLLQSDLMNINEGVSSKNYNLENSEKGIYFIRIYTDAKFEEVIRVILQ